LSHAPAEAERHGLAFVKAPGSPLNNRQLHFLTVRDGAHQQTFRARGGCCRYYTLPEGDFCTTCVMRGRADQEARLLAYLHSQFAHTNP
ncbi:MAG: (2Fe-2S)-binding protein, partial [Anaerolineae bacterium]|nr:(2Fe-2S)-binding protein [Anaerolineae bacterium]